jgi:phosphoenolpyruvate-protein phosphotransferase
MRALLGEGAPAAVIDRPGILVAEDLSPTQIVELDPPNILGICTAGGSPTSHAAILARALLIPAVVGCGESVLRLEEETRVVLDGNAGTLALAGGDAPSRESDPGQMGASGDRLVELAEARLPAVTLDGRRIEVAANIGSLTEAKALEKSGAEGVGVLRTEFLHLGRQEPPDEEEQFRVYRDILGACAGRPLIARTLDVGGDKRLPYLEPNEEDNPFLGMRGLRLSLQLPELFRCQLRALLRAGAEGGLRLMFPMVTTVEELQQARRAVEEARAELRQRGEPYAGDLPVGMMVEVPSAALMAERFAGEVDFMSVGTNDLAQYTLAADRTNASMVALGDPASPAVLRLIANVVQACHGAGIWAGVCGELAADPRLLPILVGIGIDELSMTPAAIPRIKAQIRGLEWEAARRLAARALEAASAAEVRTLAAAAAPGRR